MISCWGLLKTHQWTMWVEKEMIARQFGKPDLTVLRQRRHCQICGLIQIISLDFD